MNSKRYSTLFILTVSGKSATKNRTASRSLSTKGFLSFE
jgi:hypothetical protein